MTERTDLDALAVRVIDLEQWRKRADNRQQTSPCRSWCPSTDEHHRSAPWELQDDWARGVRRWVHYAEAGESVNVAQSEINDHGVVTSDPAEVHVYVRDSLTSDACRALAVELSAAADLVDRVNDDTPAGA